MFQKKKLKGRFVEIYSTGVAGYNKILMDTVTGVQYFWHTDGSGSTGGLCPLLNADGKPVVTPPEVLQQMLSDAGV